MQPARGPQRRPLAATSAWGPESLSLQPERAGCRQDLPLPEESLGSLSLQPDWARAGLLTKASAPVATIPPLTNERKSRRR